ncbi:hypothetical protein ACFYKX_22465 [Cytobacillus sp. FJAT-54145]|uniref:DUF4179 domain-containing protein n=1 Tax=Cytobacillus spartinae TaxID=3299023 RepID=A0ABW6KKC4_9BACI
MSNLSEHELLKKMKSLPKHELSNEERTRMVYKIRNQQEQKVRPTLLTKLGVWTAVLMLLIIGPILYYSNLDSSQTNQASGVEKAPEAITFTIIDEDGNPQYSDQIIGVPNKLGILAPEIWMANDKQSVAKIMTFVWGEPDELVGQRLKVEGQHVETGEVIELSSVELGGGLYGTGASAVTSFKPFTKTGLWNLNYFVEGEEFGSFLIYVEEPHIKIGNSKLFISEGNLTVGIHEDIKIESTIPNLPEEVHLQMFYESAERLSGNSVIFTRTGVSGGITTYTGDLNIKYSGEVEIRFMSSTTTVTVIEK